MNSEKYHKFVVPLNHWKQLKCNRKELDRLQLYPEYKWGFVAMVMQLKNMI